MTMSSAKTSSKKAPATATKKKPAAKARKDPPAAATPNMEALPFTLEVLDHGAPRTYAKRADEIEVSPPTWFAVSITGPVQKRYLHLVQLDTNSRGLVIFLLADRTALGGGQVRLPHQGSWLRAVVDGTFHVLAADVRLS